MFISFDYYFKNIELAHYILWWWLIYFNIIRNSWIQTHWCLTVIIFNENQVVPSLASGTFFRLAIHLIDTTVVAFDNFLGIQNFKFSCTFLAPDLESTSSLRILVAIDLLFVSRLSIVQIQEKIYKIHHEFLFIPLIQI